MLTLRWLAVTMLVAGLLVTGIAPAFAADDDEEKEPTEEQQKTLQVFKDLAMAGELAEYGKKNNSPEALIAAAGIYLKVKQQASGDFEKMKEPVLGKDGTPLKDVGEKTQSFDKQADDLFELAETMPVKGVNLKTLINAVKARKYEALRRAAVGGPKTITRKVQAGGFHHYNIDFVQGAPAGIAMQSTAPVRFVIKSKGKGDLANAIVTNGNYTWIPTKGTANIRIEIRGMARTAQYRIYAN